MPESPVKMPCEGFFLEGMLGWPEGKGPFGAVAVCHPHSLYGGDMNNNVVRALCEALNQVSLVSLRFNFRGVGNSGGTFAGGEGEQEDVRAALSYLSILEGVDKGQLGLAGYSFGAKVALAVAPEEERVQALALVSLPLSSPFPPSLDTYVKPRLFVCGDKDEFVAAAELRRWVGTLPSPRQFLAVPGADHFWWGREGEAAQAVADFFNTYL